MRLLALDYGQIHIGIAFADSKIGVALAQTSLLNDKKFFRKLKAICTTKKIEKLILGYPQGLHANTRQTSVVANFGSKLQTAINLPVELFNEVFSSKIAAQNLRKAKNLDSEAARIILQDYLLSQQQ